MTASIISLKQTLALHSEPSSERPNLFGID